MPANSQKVHPGGKPIGFVASHLGPNGPHMWGILGTNGLVAFGSGVDEKAASLAAESYLNNL